MLSPESVIRAAAEHQGPVVVLTGAGVSAESGVPTFRGPDGYWTAGSVHHAAETIATHAFFERDPETSWAWYLHRIGVCRGARPNAAHAALVLLERALGNRFCLLTQNVDGLHQAAGSTRVFAVHGNLHFMRCSKSCVEVVPVPENLPALARGEGFPDSAREAVRCERCGSWMRPHVLWFDEVYDEANYRYESALAAAGSAALLLVVGTTGATRFPQVAALQAVSHGARLVDVNLEENPFAALARATGGIAIQGPAASSLPGLVSQIVVAFGSS